MLKCGTLASCKSLEFQKQKLPPLGRSSASGAIALTQFRLHSKPQKRKQPFLLSRAFEALYSAGKHFGAKQKRTPTDSGRQGDGRPRPFSAARGCSPRPQVGVPRTTKPVAGFSAQWLHQPSSFPSQAAGSGCKGGFQGGDGELVRAPGQCCGRFMLLIGKLEMLAKSAAACIPAKSRGGGGGGLAASARAAGAGTRPGKDAEPRWGPLRLKLGSGSAGAGSALLGWRWELVRSLGPAAGSASNTTG